MDRWTIKDLDNTDDLTFAIAILNERKAKCTNPYAPLTQKLNLAIGTLELLKGSDMYRPVMENFKGYMVDNGKRVRTGK